MPIYEYKCPECGEKIEIFQHIGEEAPTCKNCGAKFDKLMSANSFILKGAGWATDGYIKNKKNKRKK